VVVERQAAVRELTPALDAREELSLGDRPFCDQRGRRRAGAWAEAPPALSPRRCDTWRSAITGLTVAAARTCGVVADTKWPFIPRSRRSWPSAARTPQGRPDAARRRRPHARSHRACRRRWLLLERGRFSSPRLAHLQRELRETGPQASTAIARLRRILEMHDWQHNMVFAPVAAVLMWSIHLAWALEAWRRQHGAHVRVWVRIIGEFEALASLSAYAFEHPADPFPHVHRRAAGGRTLRGHRARPSAGARRAHAAPTTSA
jgi:hypothetical protein